MIGEADKAFATAESTGSFQSFLAGIAPVVARYDAAYGTNGLVERAKRRALKHMPGLTRRVQRALGR